MMMRRIQLHAFVGIGTKRTGRARSAAPRSPVAVASFAIFMVVSGLCRCFAAARELLPSPRSGYRHPLRAVPSPACLPPVSPGQAPPYFRRRARGRFVAAAAANSLFGFSVAILRPPRCRVSLGLPAPIPIVSPGLRAHSLATNRARFRIGILPNAETVPVLGGCAPVGPACRHFQS